MPTLSGNSLYLDYSSGQGRARRFFSHSPLDFAAALNAHQAWSGPRAALVQRLYKYHAQLGASAQTRQHIDQLAEPTTWCVITGQQAGLMGGPVYTAYKIITAIRLAQALSCPTAQVVPVFWLASEDHDFAEINHTFYMQPDGEVGQVKFGWAEEGRPIADLPITDEVKHAVAAYLDSLPLTPYSDLTRTLCAPDPDDTFCSWQARFWLRLFADQGLIVVEPHVLRPLSGDFMRFALENSDEIGHRLSQVAAELTAVGYQPALDPQQAGRLFTFDAEGRRVRVSDAAPHIESAAAYPERYSTDAGLRPLWADTILPTVISVLGPGETAYQAMLKPLYELFGTPQPVLFPRKSYTIVSPTQAGLLSRYRVGARDILAEQLDIEAAFQALMPAEERAMFETARQNIRAALAPLQPYLADLDPGLEKTWAQTVSYAAQNVDKLEERAVRARLSRLGLTRRDLQTLKNVLLPRGRPQERVFPLPHFLNQYGMSFIQELSGAGELSDFRHHLLTMPDSSGDGGGSR